MELDINNLWSYGDKKLRIFLKNKLICEGKFNGYVMEADGAASAEAIEFLNSDDIIFEIPIFEIEKIEFAEES